MGVFALCGCGNLNACCRREEDSNHMMKTWFISQDDLPM